MQQREVSTKTIVDEAYSETDDPKFAMMLQHNGYPTRIDAIDGSEHLSARHLYNGICFFDDFHDTDDMDFLSMACDCALFPALATRIELACAEIKNRDTLEEIRLKTIIQLKEDCDRLGKCYWSAGYIHACRVYLDIGNYYSHLQDAGSASVMLHFHEEAARCYHRANMLLNQEPSKKLMDILYQGQGLAACGWPSYEAAREEVLMHVDATRNKTLIDETQKEMFELLHKGNHRHLRNSSHK